MERAYFNSSAKKLQHSQVADCQRYLISYLDYHDAKVRVFVKVKDILTSFEDALKIYDFETNIQKQVLSEAGKFVYSIHLHLSD
jgi:hypothetical protein